ncbi:hypothetical protein EVG20_g11108 [Dentipellis fragilis]|uniref:Uncharacterized protein n=1 Tax=Dentipellis fragilis TaxID=205917 RepID=A0A4Y9XLP4_9AGAM|nr:hypothetical protein EVG20_g11108 [Dentipellis fragilis]
MTRQDVHWHHFSVEARILVILLLSMVWTRSSFTTRFTVYTSNKKQIGKELTVSPHRLSLSPFDNTSTGSSTARAVAAPFTMSSFEPESVIAQLKALQPRAKQAQFDADWKAKVESHKSKWTTRRKTQSQVAPQLEWAAHVVALKPNVPIYGPHFVPPSYLHGAKCNTTPEIHVKTAYLKPLTIVHPFYFPELRCCPKCSCTDKRVSWNGWTTTGHREVHGICAEETALGFQLKCEACQVNNQKNRSKNKKTSKLPEGDDDEGSGSHYALTNPEFWAKRHHWEIPMGIPYFLKRCALTRELFDLIVEMRPGGTSAGIVQHIKQLHLLEYNQMRYTYLHQYQARLILTKGTLVDTPRLEQFSKPGDNDAGYDLTSITDDLITEVYLAFSEKTRKAESEDYMRTLTAICISLDNTFKMSGKATVIHEKTTRLKVMKGGILSIINELNEIITWCFCQSQAGTEIRELLARLKERFKVLGVAFPEMAVADNCCHVRSAIQDIFPEIRVLLDIWHFLTRYTICVMNGTKNPFHMAVAQDITNAIIKTRADKYNKTEYRSQEEQERHLQAAYDKYVEKGGVWTAAAEAAHRQQINHVRKGCLARPREDISSDGSRIEGTHKGWNSLQRAHSSGIEVLLALSSDFVLRRNLWNKMLTKTMRTPPASFSLLPLLPIINSGESFGLVTSKSADSYYQLTDVKDEAEQELIDVSNLSEAERERVLESINADRSMFHRPLLSNSKAVAQITDAPDPAVPAPNHVTSTLSPTTTEHDAPEVIVIDDEEPHSGSGTQSAVVTCTQHDTTISAAAVGLQQRFTSSASVLTVKDSVQLLECINSAVIEPIFTQTGSSDSAGLDASSITAQNVGPERSCKRKVAHDDGPVTDDTSDTNRTGATKRAKGAKSAAVTSTAMTAVTGNSKQTIQGGSKSTLLSFFPVVHSQNSAPGPSEKVTLATVALPAPHC